MRDGKRLRRVKESLPLHALRPEKRIRVPPGQYPPEAELCLSFLLTRMPSRVGTQ